MKVFICGKLPGDVKKIFKNSGIKTKIYAGDETISKELLMKETKNVDGILSLLNNKIDKEVIDNLSRCQVIANYAVGFNNIDYKYANKNNIIVTNTPDILTDATADLAMGLLLACARRIPEGEIMVREQKFNGWAPELLLGKELKNKTCGIIGFGRIGQAFAKRVSAFGCKVIYYNKSKKHDAERNLNARKVQLKTLMKNSDFISIHLPLNENTDNLINKQMLSLVKKDVIIINTARGEVIDEKYLISLLKKKKIFSAGFDVYQNEPKVNKELLKLKNVVLAPHSGSATIEARLAMVELASNNIINVLKGKPALTPVN